MQKKPNHTIVVLESSVNAADKYEIINSNIEFVNALKKEGLGLDEISPDAVRSYLVDYYVAEVNNGGFAQFVFNSRWDERVNDILREGLRAINAKRHQDILEEGARLVESLGRGRLKKFFRSEFFGDNAERDFLNAPNKRFYSTNKIENLVDLNVEWLRNHPALQTMKSKAEIQREIKRRAIIDRRPKKKPWWRFW